MKSIKHFPWHIILFSLYPVLFLAAGNTHEINLGVILRPLGIVLLLSMGLLAINWGFLRNILSAGLLTSLFLMLFFSYGHVYNFLRSFNDDGLAIIRNRTLFPIWMVLTVLCCLVAVRSRKWSWLPSITRSLNILGALLVVFQLTTLVVQKYKDEQPITITADAGSIEPLSSESQSSELPDIYYIILDSYGRSDVLDEVYGIDNSDFLIQLEDLGFQISDCSLSNYALTESSLASSLNMDYLYRLIDPAVLLKNGDAQLTSLIKDSLVRRILEGNGYETVAFATGYHWTEWENADHYLRMEGYWKVNEFESLLLRSSAALALIDSGVIKGEEIGIENYRSRILFNLEMLGRLPETPAPKFVFAHLLIPHRPFVFGPAGEPTLVGPLEGEKAYTREEYLEGYGNQVAYINDRILAIVSRIIASSDIPPIIILQGDHGPGLSSSLDRMSILNAYYLPGRETAIHAEISPVNTFRLIFNNYFNANFELLVDNSYFSIYDDPYSYEQINDDCP